VDPELALAAIAKETLVYSKPDWRSPKLGYLRAGAIVERDPVPASSQHCAGGWYRIAPEGHVCVGRSATLDLQHPIVVAWQRLPDRKAALPYPYGISRFPPPPFYTRIPTSLQQQIAEPGLARLRRVATAVKWDFTRSQTVPPFLQAGQPTPILPGQTRVERNASSGQALAQSGFAFRSFFEAEGRRFGLSVDLDIMPLDRLEPVRASEFRGLPLSDQVTLPVVFVRSHKASLYRIDPRNPAGALQSARRLRYREAIPITGKRIWRKGHRYLETQQGEYIRDARLVRVDPMRKRPSWATPGRTWVDVSILRQSLVAYEGARPVYVTLVSTGVDGLGDPDKSHSTVRGRFLIHTKHVTATMSGDEAGDEFDLRDVPYVQYFTEGYALHAAYWHNTFGLPRSHGCINLSPLDARWLFDWTDPPVPQGWHGALSLREGTLVNVHP
jgi:hypothetical protein